MMRSCDPDQADNAFFALEQLRSYVERKPNCTKTLNINDLLTCGLSDDLLDKFRVQCIQLEARSPDSIKMRNNSNGFESSDELSYIPSTDYDDDDFEDEDSSPANTHNINDNVVSAQDDSVQEMKTASFYKSRMTSAPPSRANYTRPIVTNAPRDAAVIQHQQQGLRQSASNTGLRDAVQNALDRPSTTGSGIKQVLSPGGTKREVPRRYVGESKLHAPRRSTGSAVSSAKLFNVNRKLTSQSTNSKTPSVTPPSTAPSVSGGFRARAKEGMDEVSRSSPESLRGGLESNSDTHAEQSSDSRVEIDAMKPNLKVKTEELSPLGNAEPTAVKSEVGGITSQPSSSSSSNSGKIDGAYESNKVLGEDKNKNVHRVSSVSTSDADKDKILDNRIRVSKSQSGNRQQAWIKQGKYKVAGMLGKGSFGEVYQGVNEHGQFFAVKKTNMLGNPQEIDKLMSEIELMKNLNHPNIVQYLGSHVDTQNHVVSIFQAWMSGGSVADMLKKFGSFSAGMIKSYTTQVLSGLSFLHVNDVVHCDIKGGNILLDEMGNVKLADFGCSYRMKQDKTMSMAELKGTPYFMAPEVFQTGKYGRKGDVWAVGCTVIQMFTCHPPWSQRENVLSGPAGLVQLALLVRDFEGLPDFVWPDKEPPNKLLSDFLGRCFIKDTEHRPTADELLKDEFLRDLEESDDLDSSLEASLRSSDATNVFGRSDQDLKLLRKQMENVASADASPIVRGSNHRPNGVNAQGQKMPVLNAPASNPMGSPFKKPSSSNPYSSRASRAKKKNASNFPQNPSSMMSPNGLKDQFQLPPANYDAQPKTSSHSPSTAHQFDLPPPNYAKTPSRMQNRVRKIDEEGLMDNRNNDTESDSSPLNTPKFLSPNVNDRSIAKNEAKSKRTIIDDDDDLEDTFDELLVMNTRGAFDGDVDDDDDTPSASALAAANAYSMELNSTEYDYEEEEVHQYGAQDDEDIDAFRTRPKIPR